MPVDHRQSADLVLLHEAQGLAQVVVGADRDRLAFGELAGGDRLRVAALCDALHHDVAVGEHALEPVVVAADRQRADVEVAHHPRRLGQGLPLLHAGGLRSHEVACYRHSDLLSHGVRHGRHIAPATARGLTDAAGEVDPRAGDLR
jgi:hypothetical protein